MLLLLYSFLELIIVIFTYEIVAALNCGSEDEVVSKMVKYSKDTGFNPSTSRPHLKKALPTTILDPVDKQLFITERQLSDVSTATEITYKIPLKGADKYLVIMQFIQLTYKLKNERIINLKLGDESVTKVDLFAQGGYGTVVQVWFQFDLNEDILYLNGSYTHLQPVLNGYLYEKGEAIISLQKVKGIPKIQSLVVVKGADNNSKLAKGRMGQQKETTINLPYHKFTPQLVTLEFLAEFMTHIQSKVLIQRDLVSEKYHQMLPNQYKAYESQSVSAGPSNHTDDSSNKDLSSKDSQTMSPVFYFKLVLSARFIGCAALIFMLVNHRAFYQVFFDAWRLAARH